MISLITLNINFGVFPILGPPLVIAYALAGRVDIDFETEPLGHDADNKPVFLADIWPTRKEIQVCSICFIMKYYILKECFYILMS